MLKTRLTEPYEPIQGKQDRQFPPTDHISHDNYLVGVREWSGGNELNFVFRMSGASQYLENFKLAETKIPDS
jgi:hypothetical protein